MDKGLKISLIVLGVASVVGATTLILIGVKNKKDEEREKRLRETESSKELKESTQTEASGESIKGYVTPTRNRNGEIVNPFSEVVGRVLYPSADSNDPSLGFVGGQNKATLRTSAEVNTGTWNNQITTYTGRTPIGTVISTETDNLNPPMRWFKVKMSKPCCGIISDYTEGYVRADVVTFNKYKKSSSVQGDMIERYDTNLLGADVFPHSNWMLPKGQNYSGANGLAFECENGLNDLN
jgi:hypothetical protein